MLEQNEKAAHFARDAVGKSPHFTLPEADLMASFLSKGTAMSVPPLNPRASISNACMPVPLRSNWTFTPSADGSDENLLIMLHGMGDGPENFVKLAMKMALPGTASLALKAPLQLPAGVQGGTIWFSTMTSDWTPLAASDVLPSFVQCMQLLRELLHALHEKAGWPFSRMHLLGFSQGGTACLGLTRWLRLGSCVSISGSLPPNLWAATAGSATTPILVTHGGQDEIQSRDEILETVGGLKASGCQVEFYAEASKGHAMVASEGEAKALMTFWSKHLKAAAPGSPGRNTIVEVGRGRVSSVSSA